MNVSEIVARTLAQFRYAPPTPGTTVGALWPEAKVLAHVERLKDCLVTPYLEKFELRETYEQVQSKEQLLAEYWVVAEDQGYLEWYDPKTNEFGLGQRRENSVVPVSIGVRGDLVGVYCAM